MATQLKAARSADVDSLYRLHREAMRDSVLQVMGVWDEDWQQRQFREAFRLKNCRAIVVDGATVGLCDYERRDDDYFLRLLEIRPDYQGRGIASTVLRRVLARARREGRPVTLFAIKAGKVRGFYERFGFTVIGETVTHYLMQTAGSRG